MSDKEDLIEAWQAYCEDNNLDTDDTALWEAFRAGWEAKEEMQ